MVSRRGTGDVCACLSLYASFGQIDLLCLHPCASLFIYDHALREALVGALAAPLFVKSIWALLCAAAAPFSCYRSLQWHTLPLSHTRTHVLHRSTHKETNTRRSSVSSNPPAAQLRDRWTGGVTGVNGVTLQPHHRLCRPPTQKKDRHMGCVQTSIHIMPPATPTSHRATSSALAALYCLWITYACQAALYCLWITYACQARSACNR